MVEVSEKSTSNRDVISRLEKHAESGKYCLAAYDFVLRGLDQTIRALPEVRHVNGQELMEGLQAFAKEQFGPMAKHVLNSWEITRTEDFGEIVFELVDQGILRKTEEDRPEDFADRFDFDVVFERDYYKDHKIPSA